MRLQNTLALLAGCVSICLQAAGISTNYWLHTWENLAVPESKEAEDVNGTDHTQEFFRQYGRECAVVTKWHSGLWHICPVTELIPDVVCKYPNEATTTTPAIYSGEGAIEEEYEGDELEYEGELDYEGDPPLYAMDSEYEYIDEPAGDLFPCMLIQYYTVNKRIESDTTTSILRGMRFSTPFHILSLLLYITALITLLLGHIHQDKRTVIGAVVLVLAGLISGIGLILYILAISNELSFRPKPKQGEDITFRYWYGWSFCFTVAAFILSQLSAVAHVSAYLKRFPDVDLISQVVPGLARKAAYQLRPDKYPDFEDIVLTVRL